MGDSVLVAVARALSQEGALVGRYGGDEFVTILPGASRENAKRYCKEVRNAMAAIQLIDEKTGDRVSVMASTGLAFYPEDAQTVIELVKLSDSAMYAQKRQRPIDRAA
jgi:diguanylate cyclase (GGDEF)-like protein